MIQSHRSQLIDIDNLVISERVLMEAYRDSEEKEARLMFDRAQLIKRTEIEHRKVSIFDIVLVEQLFFEKLNSL